MAARTDVLREGLAAGALQRDRVFYTGMAGAILLTIFVGFGRGYYLRGFTKAPPLPTLVHLHASVFTAWVLLFFGQTTLVAAGRTDLHRRLGIVGSALAGLMIILAIMTALYGARNGWAPGGAFPDPLAFSVVTLGDILLFSGFVVAGLYYRQRREVHKRLMLLATIGGLLWPAITRLPYLAGRFRLMFALMVLFVLAGPIHDFIARRRVHTVYIWGGLLILASFPLRRAIGMSDTWHRIAAWLIG